MKTKPLYDFAEDKSPSSASVGEEIRKALEKRGLRASLHRSIEEEQERMNVDNPSVESNEAQIPLPEPEAIHQEIEDHAEQIEPKQAVALTEYPQEKDEEVATEPLTGAAVGEAAVLDPSASLSEYGSEAKAGPLGELLAMTSHELRTPLQTVTGFLELLLSGKVPDAQRVHRFLSIAHRESQYLANRITDIEAASLIQTGTFGLNPVPLSMDCLIAACVQHLLRSVGEKKLRVEQATLKDLPTFHGDEGRLQHAINNVLEAALRSVDSDGIVRVHGHLESEDLHILISCCPVKPSSTSNVAAKDKASQQASAALGGMGIFMAQYLIEAHGGHIKMHGEGDQTFVYDIDLPLKPEGKSKGTILVTEDNPHASLLLEYALEREGFTPILARDGEEALERIAQGSVDLVLLDVVLPGIDGFEVCRKMRALPDTASIPVIMISAKANEQDRANAFLVGADAYLQKPLGLSELIYAVENLLEKGRAPAKGQALKDAPQQ